jgi:hypothetical protein
MHWIKYIRKLLQNPYTFQHRGAIIRGRSIQRNVAQTYQSSYYVAQCYTLCWTIWLRWSYKFFPLLFCSCRSLLPVEHLQIICYSYRTSYNYHINQLMHCITNSIWCVESSFLCIERPPDDGITVQKHVGVFYNAYECILFSESVGWCHNRHASLRVLQ